MDIEEKRETQLRDERNRKKIKRQCVCELGTERWREKRGGEGEGKKRVRWRVGEEGRKEGREGEREGKGREDKKKRH